MRYLISIVFLSVTVVAKMQPEQVLTKTCLEYYQSYDTYKTHKAFVYAREKETDKDRCNWAYGHTSRQAAIESAMKGCQSEVLNAECLLIDSDGKFDVLDATFTTLTPIDETTLSKVQIDTFMQEAKGLILGNCFPFFEKYLKANDHKSFAYSVDANGDYACGYSYENQSEKISKRQAIKSCNDNKAQRGDASPKSECKVYATNKKVLLLAKDFDIKPLPKAVKLSAKAYKQKLTEAQKIIHNGSCRIQFKYYLKSKVHNAYYLLKSKDRQEMCGRYEGAFSSESAKQKAKESCEKHAKEKNIRGHCILLSEDFKLVGNAKKIGAEQAKKDENANFESALHKGKLEQVKAYIKQGGDIHTQSKKDGITALFLAAAKGDKDFFFALIKKGAKLEHKASDNSTLLHAAAMGANEEIVKYLLEKGFDVNAKGFEGNTPLHISSMMMKENISKLLIDAGANQNIKNDKDERAGAALRELEEKITNMVMDEINKTKIKKPQQSTDLNRATSLKNAIAIAVQAMRKNLPMKIDDALQLSKVRAKENRMILGYTLTTLSSKDISATMLKSMLYEDVKKQVCSDNETVTMLKKGMIAEYAYEGRDHKYITNFSFDAKVCGFKTNAAQLIENVKNILHEK